jgi:hypothetical protein
MHHMVRIRRGWSVVVLALGLGASACQAPPPAAKTTEAKATATPGKAALAPASGVGAPLSGVIGDDLSLIPSDSEAVIGINFAQLQQSSSWKQYVAPKLGSALGIDKFKALCGFDPLDSLKSVAIGLKGLGGSGKDVSGTIVVHGYDKTKAMACFDKDGVKDAEKDGSKVVIDRDVVLVTDKSGQHVGFTFVNNDTAIAVIGPDASTTDGVKKVASGGSQFRTSPAFLEMFQTINSQDTLWLVANGNSPVFSRMHTLGVNLRALFGSLNLTDGLAVNMRLRLDSPDAASNVVSLAKGQLTQAKFFFDKLDVSSNGPDVKFDVAMSKAKLTQLAGTVASMMGGGNVPD